MEGQKGVGFIFIVASINSLTWDRGKMILYWGREPEVDLDAHLIGREDGNFPIFAYIDSTWLNLKRAFIPYRRVLSSEQNHVDREYGSPSVDPFILATLITMAQTQYHSALREETGGEDEDSYQVFLLHDQKPRKN
jgi:hypothetical protein